MSAQEGAVRQIIPNYPDIHMRLWLFGPVTSSCNTWSPHLSDWLLANFVGFLEGGVRSRGWSKKTVFRVGLITWTNAFVSCFGPAIRAKLTLTHAPVAFLRQCQVYVGDRGVGKRGTESQFSRTHYYYYHFDQAKFPPRIPALFVLSRWH